MNVYQVITENIMAKLKEGVVPWQKPWNSLPAVNWVTQRPYRGINTILLEPGEYATFKQVSEAGGKVKKGAKSHIIVFWKWIEKDSDEVNPQTGMADTLSFPILRYYRVFEINTQCEGLETKRKVETYQHDPLEKAEEIIFAYKEGPTVDFGGDKAFYRPATDHVRLPEKEYFKTIQSFYSVFFHELVHSTGHEKRLNRKEIVTLNSFGSHDYSKEELVAEIGAAMLCGVAGIEQATMENSVAYLQSWLKALKDDDKLIVLAAAQAQKAADHILGETLQKEEM